MTTEEVSGKVPLNRCWVVWTTATTATSQEFVRKADLLQPAVSGMGRASLCRHFFAARSFVTGSLGAYAAVTGWHSEAFRMRTSASAILKLQTPAPIDTGDTGASFATGF